MLTLKIIKKSVNCVFIHQIATSFRILLMPVTDIIHVKKVLLFTYNIEYRIRSSWTMTF